MQTTSTTRRLFDLAWPIIGINVLQVLALAVDTAMVGRTPQAETALTGMGYAGQLVFLLMVAMIGLTVGTVVFVSRAHGAGHDERVDHILHQSTQLTVVLGIGVAVAGNLLAVPLLTLLGADDASMAAGLSYLRPLLIGTTANYLNILFAAVLRGLGNTRLAFAVALVMNVLNALFNYALILGNFGLPAFGIAGAAYGTVAAQCVAMGLMVLLLSRGWMPGIHPRFTLRPLDVGLAKDLVRIGLPAATDMVVLNAGFLSIVGMLGRIDQAAVAAHGVGLRIQALAFVPGMSIAQATGALVGSALGAGDVEEARRVVRASIVLCTLVMSGLALAIIAAAGPIVQLFDIPVGSPLYDYAVMWLKLLGYGMPIVGTFISLGGLLQGAGDTRVSLRINAVTTLAVQIPMSAILGFGLGLGAWGVWVAFPASFVIKTAWAVVVYRRGEWAKIGDRV